MLPKDVPHRQVYWLIAAFFLTLICYHFLIYQTVRQDFLTVLLLFTIAFIIYLLVIRFISPRLLTWVLALGILIRLSLLLAIPELSDDFYRFIWDGLLLAKGESPFAELPSKLMEDPSFAAVPFHDQLFQGMNSKDYFTIYPPVSQWTFFISATLFPNNLLGNLVVMRLFIILAEFGSILLLISLLKKNKIPTNQVLIYAWNPLVIVELTGNLHFEAIMVFFLLLAIYFLNTKKLRWSSAALATSIATKLIPLIFLPLLMFRIPWRKVVVYWTICAVVVLGLFLTIWSPELTGSMQSSLSLYFQKFEFNASIYYLVREVGFAFKGYNIIHIAGKYLALLTLVAILLFAYYSYRSMTWPRAMIWALTIYLFMSTTVHPWYITPLVALVVFTNYRFPIVWSMAVILSYAGYREVGYTENLYLVSTEYAAVVFTMIWDFTREDHWTNRNGLNMVSAS